MAASGPKLPQQVMSTEKQQPQICNPGAVTLNTGNEIPKFMLLPRRGHIGSFTSPTARNRSDYSLVCNNGWLSQHRNPRGRDRRLPCFEGKYCLSFALPNLHPSKEIDLKSVKLATDDANWVCRYVCKYCKQNTFQMIIQKPLLWI